MKNVFIMILLFCLFLSCGCTERKISEKIKELKVLKLYKTTDSENKLPFILDFPGFKNKPVVKMKLDNINFYFLVDTGAGINILNSNGIKKIRKVPLDLNYFEYCDIRFLIDKDDKSRLPSEKNSLIDGVLGIEYLWQFESVIINYITKELVFNESLTMTTPWHFYIRHRTVYCDFFSNNKKYEGCIDTGCDACIFNKDFFADSGFEEDVLRIISSFQICEQQYNDIPILRSDSSFISVEENSRDSMKRMNFLGAPVFLNHILKLNFRTMEFEIS